MSPEGNLIAAIFAQAMADMGIASTASNSPEADADAAFSFLTGSGRWKKQRDHLASLIGFDGDDIRDRTVAFLEGKNEYLVGQRADRLTPKVAALARERWSKRKAVLACRADGSKSCSALAR